MYNYLKKKKLELCKKDLKNTKKNPSPTPITSSDQL